MNNIKIISEKLLKINKKLYIIGGWTRNKIIDKNYDGDIDFATNATPEEIQSILTVLKEVGKKYGTLIIKEGNEKFEITTFRKDIGILDNRKPVKVEFTTDLKLDSQRRDFTINSIYYDVQNDEFIDPQNGIKDLNNEIIRFVGNIQDRIKEDALRILRFIRFKNKYSLKVAHENYFRIIKQNISLLKNISIERIKEELEKIFLLENNIQALKDLKEIGFFEILLPEVEELEKTPGGPKHHLEGNVWVHTLMTIRQLNIILDSGLSIFNNNGQDQTIFYSQSEKILFYWTMLLHDIGKAPTYSLDNNGNIHYYGHEELGSKIFLDISKRLNFTKLQHKKILWLIDNHLRIFKVIKMRKLKARKFMMHEFFRDLILVGIVDNLGRKPVDENIVLEFKNFYKDFLTKLKDKKFYTGGDIIKKYPNLKGYEIKNKLNALNDEILIKD